MFWLIVNNIDRSNNHSQGLSMTSYVARTACLAAAITLAWGHSLVHASANASASIGKVQYTLTDLDPNDGVAPSITWGASQLNEFMTAQPSNGVDTGGGPNVIDSYSNSISSANPTSNASLNYQGFSTSGGPDGVTAAAVVPLGAQWFQKVVFGQDFSLSANTAVTFTAEVKTSQSVEVVPGSMRAGPDGRGYFDWAALQSDITALLYVGSGDPNGGSPPSCFAIVGCLAQDFVYSPMRVDSSEKRSQNRLLSATFKNSTQNQLTSTLTSFVKSDSYATAPLSFPTSIPEPSTIAQLSLGLLGLIALRRRAV
jgi:hypothetical protein